MDGNFDIDTFIAIAMLFFLIPFSIIIAIINYFVSRRITRKGLLKSKYYWIKLVGYSVLILISGLFLYDGYYKLMA